MEPRMTNNQDNWMSLALKREAEIERLRAALKDANEVLEKIETDSDEQTIAAVAGRCAERISRCLLAE